MAELIPDHRHWHALGDELGGVRVAHLVRHDPPLDSRMLCCTPQHGPDVLLRHRGTPEGAQEGAPADTCLTALVHPALDCRHGTRFKADRPRLVTLAVHDAHGTALGVNVGRTKRQRLSDPQATRYKMMISARLRMPVSETAEQAPMIAFTSVSASTSAWYRCPLLAGACPGADPRRLVALVCISATVRTALAGARQDTRKSATESRAMNQGRSGREILVREDHSRRGFSIYLLPCEPCGAARLAGQYSRMVISPATPGTIALAPRQFRGAGYISRGR